MNMLPLKKIICAFDFSVPSRLALHHAGDLAAKFDAELCVVHVMEPLTPILGIMTKAEFDASRSADAALEIHRIVEKQVEKNVDLRAIVKSGDPATEILHVAREEQPDLIVIATHGRTGWQRLAVGSVVEEVARLTPFPVLTVHEPNRQETGAASIEQIQASIGLSPDLTPGRAAAGAVPSRARTGAEEASPPDANPRDANPRDANPRNVREEDFPEHGSEADKLGFLLNYAVLAPSNRNTQPWLWKLNGDSVELYADRSRSLPVADPQDRELMIGCGAALYNLRLAIRHFGYHDEVLALPRSSDPDLLARVALGSRLQPENVWDAERKVFQAIAKRHTSRTLFENREIPAALRQILKDTARSKNAVLRFVGNDERDTVVDLIARGEVAQNHSAEFRSELAGWLRPLRGPHQDGVAATAFGLSDSFSRLAPAAMRVFDGGEAQAGRDTSLVRSAPLLALLETEDDTPHHWLAAGQALEAVLLRAAGEGVYASYFNQPVEAGGLWRELRQELGLSLFPQMLFRLGFAGSEGSVPLSPRRPVSEVLIQPKTCSGAERGTVA